MSYIVWLDDPQASRPGLWEALAPLARVNGVRRVSSVPEFEGALASSSVRLCVIGALPAGASEAAVLATIQQNAPGLTVLWAADAEIERARRLERKKEALRELGSRIGHDLNNMLGVIVSYASMSMDGPLELDARREDAAQILAAAERMRAVTDQLLAFSRRSPPERQRIELAQFLARMQVRLQSHTGERVQWVSSFVPDAFVRVDPERLEYAVLQLVLNANDAMPSGGRLEFSVSEFQPTELRLCVAGQLAPGRYLRLSVSDSGRGVPPDLRPRLFEPFFSHARNGKGLGLGLNIVQDFVTIAGGGLDLESAPGRGTEVHLYLPRDEA